MDAEIVKALAELPAMVVLIYLLVRMQAEKEKLLAALIESEREHARNLVAIACGRDRLPDSNLYPSNTLGD